jgi:hypothetical protein
MANSSAAAPSRFAQNRPIALVIVRLMSAKL